MGHQWKASGAALAKIPLPPGGIWRWCLGLSMLCSSASRTREAAVEQSLEFEVFATYRCNLGNLSTHVKVDILIVDIDPIITARLIPAYVAAIDSSNLFLSNHRQLALNTK